MRTRLALAAAALTAALAAAGLAPATGTVALTPAALAKSCSGSYVHAALPWGHKCLRAGQLCKLGGDRHYHRYRYHCHRSSRDASGSYHLTR